MLYESFYSATSISHFFEGLRFLEHATWKEKGEVEIGVISEFLLLEVKLTYNRRLEDYDSYGIYKCLFVDNE